MARVHDYNAEFEKAQREIDALIQHAEVNGLIAGLAFAAACVVASGIAVAYGLADGVLLVIAGFGILGIAGILAFVHARKE